MTGCKHEQFVGEIKVNRLEDTGRFMCDVTVRCAACGKPFQFLGLPIGLNLNGATTDFDGTEARLAVCPQGERPTALEPGTPTGFSVKLPEGVQ